MLRVVTQRPACTEGVALRRGPFSHGRRGREGKEGGERVDGSRDGGGAEMAGGPHGWRMGEGKDRGKPL